MTLAEKALEIALTQLGVKEVPRGSNRGPQVDEYIKSVGLDPAGKHPWCAAFIYWCFDQAAKQMGVKNPLFKTGHCQTQYARSKVKYGITSPRPGDVAYLDYGSGKGHMYIVQDAFDLEDKTVEGNTNDEGSREGYEVCQRQRPRRKVKYLRFA